MGLTNIFGVGIAHLVVKAYNVPVPRLAVYGNAGIIGHTGNYPRKQAGVAA